MVDPIDAKRLLIIISPFGRSNCHWRQEWLDLVLQPGRDPHGGQ